MSNRIGYETTDRKIIVDIYGLEFEVNKTIEEYDVKTIIKDKEEKDLNYIIADLLGTDALTKINKKRVEDGYKEADLEVKITIISAVVQFYIRELTKPFEDIARTYQQANRVIYNNRKYRRRYRRY